MTAAVPVWRFQVAGRGPKGIEVLAASEGLAWAKLRAAEGLADAVVEGGPVQVRTVAIQGVTLGDILGVERAA